MSAARYLSRLVAATAFPHGNYRHGRNRPQVETTCFRRSISRRSEGCLQTLLEEPTDELLPVGTRSGQFPKFENLELKAAKSSKAVAADTFSMRRLYGEIDPKETKLRVHWLRQSGHERGSLRIWMRAPKAARCSSKGRSWGSARDHPSPGPAPALPSVLP